MVFLYAIENSLSSLSLSNPRDVVGSGAIFMLVTSIPTPPTSCRPPIVDLLPIILHPIHFNPYTFHCHFIVPHPPITISLSPVLSSLFHPPPPRSTPLHFNPFLPKIYNPRESSDAKSSPLAFEPLHFNHCVISHRASLLILSFYPNLLPQAPPLHISILMPLTPTLSSYHQFIAP